MAAEHTHGGARDDRGQRRAGALHLVEWLLLFIGACALGYFTGTLASAAWYQHQESRRLDALLSGASATDPTAGTAVPVPGAALGRIEIPRLGISTIVKDGEDTATLRLAVGHISGTPLPGQPGNVGLAGHRDTFFRRLRDVVAGDRIRLVTTRGTYTYVVERTRIVRPEDVWVLDPTPQPSLTLVTCYPFTYFGAAPERFIVRARLAASPMSSGVGGATLKTRGGEPASRPAGVDLRTGIHGAGRVDAGGRHRQLAAVGR